jgi:Holliday junction resolvase-like predicted endonuclease
VLVKVSVVVRITDQNMTQIFRAADCMISRRSENDGMSHRTDLSSRPGRSKAGDGAEGLDGVYVLAATRYVLVKVSVVVRITDQNMSSRLTDERSEIFRAADCMISRRSENDGMSHRTDLVCAGESFSCRTHH